MGLNINTTFMNRNKLSLSNCVTVGFKWLDTTLHTFKYNNTFIL